MRSSNRHLQLEMGYTPGPTNLFCARLNNYFIYIQLYYNWNLYAYNYTKGDTDTQTHTHWNNLTDWPDCLFTVTGTSMANSSDIRHVLLILGFTQEGTITCVRMVPGNLIGTRGASWHFVLTLKLLYNCMFFLPLAASVPQAFTTKWLSPPDAELNSASGSANRFVLTRADHSWAMGLYYTWQAILVWLQ